jgi:hypothetical protein
VSRIVKNKDSGIIRPSDSSRLAAEKASDSYNSPRKTKIPKSNGKVLARRVFTMSRENEFFTEKELQMQLGHRKSEWRISILKELIDNALDACEVADVRPEITVEDRAEGFSVADNGPGIPVSTIKKSMDYLVRVSDKQYYVSPSRGQMGNALKCVWAAPFVSGGQAETKIVIECKGQRHTVITALDRIAQRPVMAISAESTDVKNGTKITVPWPQTPRLDPEEESYSYNPPLITPGELISHYALFNPGASFNFGDKTYAATVPTWSKWRTDYPTSAHWYNEFQLRDLIAAYIYAERGRDESKAKTVREFVTEFRGLSGTAKGVKITEGFKGVYLRDLEKNGDIDMAALTKLLTAMKANSFPVKGHQLGFIGEAHLKGWAEANIGIVPTSWKYFKSQGIDDKDGLPFTVEIVFALKTDTEKAHRTVVTGMNWSPTIGTPADEISEIIGLQRIGPQQPVLQIIHLAKPKFQFTDRGKTRVDL